MDLDRCEQQRLLHDDAQHLDEESWSDDSTSNSYCSDSDSSVPEWEFAVDDTTGELLYIDCHPFVVQNNIESKKQRPQCFTKDPLRHSTRGKFLKLLRRRDSQRHSRLYQKTQEPFDANTNKVKFRDSQEGEEKDVFLKISSNHVHRIEAETFLGIHISTLSDGVRVMVAGFPSDSKAKHEKNIKIGDWLKSINDIIVTYQNINSVLDKLRGKSELLLKLQRVAGVEVTKNPPMNELNCQSEFVRDIVTSNIDNEDALNTKLCQCFVGVTYLNTSKLSETNSNYEDVIYCYPHSHQNSIICQTRGIFLTLNHLLADITNTYPRVSSISIKNKLYNITYVTECKKVFLLMVPDSYANIKEIILLNNALIRMLKFMYGTLEQCFLFESNKAQLDHFFGRFFVKILNRGNWIRNGDFLSLSIDNLKLNFRHFEFFLPGAPVLNLPNEAYMQVDDALTELEASDYREWNEDPLDCQRLFTVLGSALYHCKFLIASHLMHDDLVDVQIFLKHNGFLHLASNEPVKTLLLWKGIFPSSCGINANVKVPLGRRYLLLAGSGKNLLAVIMEAGGCTEPSDDHMGPDAFYVEEVQATLAHIQELGIPELADRWLGTNPGPQITIPESSIRKKNDFIDSTKHKDPKKAEVTSILKRRSSDVAPITQSVYSLADSEYSEDSASHSEISDENSQRFNDDDSDPDDYADGSQLSSNSFDISELRQTILSETEYPQQQLTSGKVNVLFHFVQFDATEGLIVSPPECRLSSQTFDSILNNFRKVSMRIHTLFENTMRFKSMSAQDMAKSVMNKSLIAIKEYGIMFECYAPDDVDNRKNNLKYWVLGRLFYTPHPKEIYVCYQDNIPQNIIEMALKIELSNIN